MGPRYVCIHGHFYQPPRENAWLEAIEFQESAAPYHDWNERITAECYGPNAHARILDAHGMIERIINNYASISFNFGPTLLTWMQPEESEVYRAIIEGDRLSQKRFGGHGSAIAQTYNHMIMPLANARDQKTQVLWGIGDFEYRFGRKPEGMWLPETAVDVASLEALAAEGIKFTILEPHQAARFRRIGQEPWTECNGAQIDPTMAYVCNLPSGKSIALFFYDGPISRAIAFEGLLNRGENLATRLMGGFDDIRSHAQIVNIATDGESYGHHHRFGEMALAYATQLIEGATNVELINYGQYLELHPPTHEVEIRDNTAWSCAHGVERWRSNCGCNTGGHPGWSQEWRGPLRGAMDWLRDEIAPVFEASMEGFLKDPWGARDAYIEVVLSRTPGRLDRFFSAQAARELSREEKIHVLDALEMQRHAMLMFTSCAWFFDDVSGIETVQIIQYAARTAQLASRLSGRDFEQPMLERLAAAKSNVTAAGDGRAIWEKQVPRAHVDLAKVAAHYGVSSLFRQFPKIDNVYSFSVDREDAQEESAGTSRLAIGHVKVTSDVIRDSEEFIYAVLYFGGHNLTGGVCPWKSEEHYQSLSKHLKLAFERADLMEVIRYLDHSFKASTYSLRSLFKDDQQRVLDRMLQPSIAQVEATYREIHERNIPLSRFMQNLGIPKPRAFQAAADVAVGSMLRDELEHEQLNVARIQELLKETEEQQVKLSAESLEYPMRRRVERLMTNLSNEPENLVLLKHFEEVVRLVPKFPFVVNLAKVQNRYYRIMTEVYPGIASRAAMNPDLKEWVEVFKDLGGLLGVKFDDRSSK